MSAWRIGLRLAANPSRASRWRQLNVVVCAALFLLLAASAVALDSMAEKQDERAAARLPMVSGDRAASDVYLLQLSDEWRGATITVVYLEPTGASADAVLPPGLSTLPGPGEFSVSPALDRLADTHPGLDARYADRSTLGTTGVTNGDELIAYRGVPRGTLSRDGDAILRMENGEYVGDGPVRRIASFGSPDTRLIELRRPAGAMTAGLLAGLVVPAVIVLAVGLAASSPVRARRVGLLRSLGTPTFFVASVLVAEALALAVAGFLLAAVAAWFAFPRLRHVPFVGREVVPGDLAIGWPALALLVAGGTVLTVVLALTTTPRLLRRSLESPTRPAVDQPARPGTARTAPLVLAAASFVTGAMLGGEQQAEFLLVGTMLTVVGVPLVLPLVIQTFGGHLSGQRAVIASLIGRAMAWDPSLSARPFLGLAAIILLMTSASGYLAVAAFTERPTGLSDGPQAVTVEWGGSPHEGRLHELEHALPGNVVAPFESRAAETGPGSHLTLSASCAEVARVVGFRCVSDDPAELTDDANRQLSDVLYFAGHEGRVVNVELAPPTDEPHHAHGAGGHHTTEPSGHEASHLHRQHTVVLGSGSLYTLDERVRTAATAHLPVSSVSSPLLSFQVVSPMVPWIKGGVAAASLALLAACFLALVDQQVSSSGRRRYLSRIGADRGWYRGLIAGLFAAPFLLASGFGLAMGAIVCRLLVRDISPMPWSTISGVAVFLLVACLGGALVVITADARRLEEPA